jgi:hypothetical protein
MSLVYVDSFDHYGSSDFLKKWTSSRNAAPDSNFPQTGRFGQAWFGNTRWWRKDFAGDGYTANDDVWIIGFAFKHDGPNSTTNDSLVNLMDGGSYQVGLNYDWTNQRFYVQRNGTQIGSFGNYTMSGAGWHYVEFKVTIHNSAGSIQVKVDENNIIGPTSSLDTQNTGTAQATGIRIGSAPCNPIGGTGDDFWSVYIDDLYVFDGNSSGVSGAPNNDFIGDVRIEALYPNGNGNSSQWVGSDSNSTDNYLLVDEHPPNDDTDYTESSTVGNKDTYAFTNCTPASATVYGTQNLTYAKKTDAGARTLKIVERLSATERDGSAKTLSTSYGYHRDVHDSDPTGTQWTLANVNAAEFGRKVDT